ncbi:18005_t:CDS:2 [Funneliformis geosporum]|uniref:18005_t:CDS:1 n=1 Tax=Funneliformis geosporum TaxID=1117311 RepID=A0A9W4SZK2_9GLOM|nr:18005_t:CDS:2 [Funneliformis geosporum]
MVTHLHEKFYRSNATQLSESDIKEIRESRELILSSINQLALDKTEQTLEVVLELSFISLPATEIPKKNGRKKKVKIYDKLITEAIRIVEKNNKNGVVSDNSSDTS